MKSTVIVRRRSAFTLIELLVVIAIIGVLTGLLLPAVQSAREAARRTQCKNHLKQLGLAVQTYHDTNQFIPPSRPRDRFVTWVTLLMPFMDQQPLYDKFEILEPYARQDAEATAVTIPIMFCPSRRSPEISDFEIFGPRGACGDYGGNAGYNSYWADPFGDANGVFLTGLRSQNPIVNNRLTTIKGRLRLVDIVDGLSNTTFIGEKAVNHDYLRQPGGWGDGSVYNSDDPGTLVRLGGPLFPIASSEEYPAPGPGTIPVFGSPHPGVTQFVFGDGSVRPVTKTVDTTTLGKLCSRLDGGVAENY